MAKIKMYTKLAKYYDKIYNHIDYEKQVEFILDVIKKYDKSKNKKILDVACGTGNHANLLFKKGFEITGVDISPDMLRVARKKNKKIKYIQDDMKKIKLKEKYGTIICYFNAILYNTNLTEMKTTLKNFRSHLANGSLLIFDMYDKLDYKERKVGEHFYEDDELQSIFKWNTEYNGDNILFDNEHIINGKSYPDLHKVGAFTIDEIKSLLENIGFEVLICKKLTYDAGTTFVCRK